MLPGSRTLGGDLAMADDPGEVTRGVVEKSAALTRLLTGFLARRTDRRMRGESHRAAEGRPPGGGAPPTAGTRGSRYRAEGYLGGVPRRGFLGGVPRRGYPSEGAEGCFGGGRGVPRRGRRGIKDARALANEARSLGTRCARRMGHAFDDHSSERAGGADGQSEHTRSVLVQLDLSNNRRAPDTLSHR